MLRGKGRPPERPTAPPQAAALLSAFWGRRGSREVGKALSNKGCLGTVIKRVAARRRWEAGMFKAEGTPCRRPVAGAEATQEHGKGDTSRALGRGGRPPPFLFLFPRKKRISSTTGHRALGHWASQRERQPQRQDESGKEKVPEKCQAGTGVRGNCHLCYPALRAGTRRENGASALRTAVVGENSSAALLGGAEAAVLQAPTPPGLLGAPFPRLQKCASPPSPTHTVPAPASAQTGQGL